MKDREANELLTRILDGNASEEERSLLLSWLENHPAMRGEVAEQLAIDGLLGVALEKQGGRDFRERLRDQLIAEEKRNLFRRIGMSLRRNTRRMALVLGPLLAAFAWFATFLLLGNDTPGVDDPGKAAWTAAVLVLCVVWWILEPVPIGAVSLIPLAVLPLAGVLDEWQIAAAYCHHLVVLFLSGFMLSRAMEHCGLHRRLALGLVRVIGGSSERRIVLGFMMASAGISMWISNTVTVLMLLPAALAVIDHQRRRRLATPLLLGIAYSAAIGGMGSPIGTPPNGIFLAQTELLAEAGFLTGSFGFMDWMKVGIPIVLILVPVAWLWLTRGPWPSFPVRIAPAGSWSKAEVRLSVVLALTVLLWITRDDPFGGWSALLDAPEARDSSVGLLAVIALFLIPSGEPEERKLLNWEQAAAVPWSILILLGGGIAIGSALSATGLNQAIAANLTLLHGLPVLFIVAIVALCVSFITELSSSTATATVLMPLLAAMAVAADLPPVFLMLAATMANSCSFMLPVSTPPNAIVFAVGDFTIRRMIWEGLVLKLVSVAVITAVCYLLLG